MDKASKTIIAFQKLKILYILYVSGFNNGSRRKWWLAAHSEHSEAQNEIDCVFFCLVTIKKLEIAGRSDWMEFLLTTNCHAYDLVSAQNKHNVLLLQSVL